MVSQTPSGPVPEVATIAELNPLIDGWDVQDEARRIRSRTQTIGERFVVEQPFLAPLPVERFETGRLLTLGSTGAPRSACAPTATRCPPG